MKRDFMVERQGRWFALYAGLLDEAHAQGLKSIRTQLLQTPSPENGHTAVCFAEVTTDRGTYTGLGDASPDNVARMMVPHLIRMSETRAKARALRDAVNVGVTALEELAELDEVQEQSEAPGRGHERPTEVSRAEETKPAAVRPTPVSAPTAVAPSTNGGLATPNQVRAIYSIARDQFSLDEAQVDQKAVVLYGAPPAELTKKQASDFITALKAKEL